MKSNGNLIVTSVEIKELLQFLEWTDLVILSFND